MATPEAKENVATMVRQLVTSFVDNEQDVSVKLEQLDTLMLFKVTVAPGDFGKLIGRHGLNARSIRLLVRAWGRKHGVDAYVKVIDPQGNEYRVPDPEDDPSTTAPHAKPRAR